MKCLGMSSAKAWGCKPTPAIAMLGSLLISFACAGCKRANESDAASNDDKAAPTSQSAAGEMTSSSEANESVVEDVTSAVVGPADVPEVDVNAFEPVIREQLTAAIGKAEANPESAEAVGALAMLLDSYRLNEQASQLYQSASALDPNDFRWAYLGGRLLFFGGKSEQAVEFLTRASKLKPDDIPSQVALINALVKVERLQDAGRLAADLLEKNPKHPLASYLLGSINRKLKAPIFAMEYLKPVFEQFPNMGGVRREMIATIEMLGQKEKAEQLRAVEVNNNHIPTIEDPHHEAVLKLAIGTNIENERAAFALMRGDAAAARSHFANALAYSPQNLSARIGSAESHLRLGEFEKVEEFLEPLIAKNSETAAGFLLLGKLRLAQGRYEEVPKIIEQAGNLGADPDHVLKLEFGLAEAQKDLPRIVELLEQILQKDPTSPGKHFDLANAYVFSDRYDDALKEYQKTLELEPRHAGAMQGLGAIYTSRGENDAARTWYLKAFENGGTAPRTLSWAGRDALDRGDYERGAAILSQAYAAYPKDRDLGEMLSRTYSMCPEPSVRDWEKAMRIALELYGDDEETMPFSGLHTLAAAHAEAGNFEEAARIMEVGVQRASKGSDPNNILPFSKSKRQYAAGKHLYDPEVIPSEYE